MTPACSGSKSDRALRQKGPTTDSVLIVFCLLIQEVFEFIGGPGKNHVDKESKGLRTVRADSALGRA